jgi:anti-sigma factor RsiW
MNNDQQLQLQSYLDGELSPRESRQVTQLLAIDSDARALVAELKNTKTAMKDNELEIKLPESREFFFSKIQRQIEREAQIETRKAAPQEPFFVRLRRYFLPLAGATAAIILFAVMSEKRTMSLAYVPGEGETSDEMTAYTYRSQADGMTVVWLADNSSSTAENNSNATEIQ